MQTYRTDSIPALVRWVEQCHGLSQTSRSNLLDILDSARFRSAVQRTQPSEITVDYQQDASGEPLPRRVRVHADGTSMKIAITSDRGAWILSG
jgi:hypothetical protein